MTISLNHVVPWGRSLDEYQRMFDLSENDLRLKILGCGDGPASFNAEMTALGHSVVSIDPIYALTGEQITQRVRETYDTIITQVKLHVHTFVWRDFRDADDLGRHRLAAMDKFLRDYPAGLIASRYLPETLPQLSFADQQFDLALCSHLLFLYSEQFSFDFHLASVCELCRVAREARIFPLLALDGKKSPHVEDIQACLAVGGWDVEIVAVPYEFQVGGNQMMRIKQG